jgi:hypothetical protein
MTEEQVRKIIEALKALKGAEKLLQDALRQK